MKKLIIKNSEKMKNSDCLSIRTIRVYETGCQSFKLVHERVPMVNETDKPGNYFRILNPSTLKNLKPEIERKRLVENRAPVVVLV